MGSYLENLVSRLMREMKNRLSEIEDLAFEEHYELSKSDKDDLKEMHNRCNNLLNIEIGDNNG